MVIIEQPKDKNCPECTSESIEFDENHGFYRCNCCGHTWAYDGDDPDYDDCEELPEKYDPNFSYPKIYLGKGVLKDE